MRRLNGILATTAVMVALAVLPVAASAGISGSKHDFSSQGWSGGEICVVCHTPHNGDTSLAAPLWNHQVTAVSTYTPYAGSATLTATDIDQPGDVSKLCLSCHDGTVAIDSFGGATGTVPLLTSTDAGYIGTNLSDDHPVGFTYDATLATTDGGLHDPTATDAAIALRPGNIDVAMLFGTGNDQMECASCHDPHRAAGNDPMLRKSNASSALCLTCHNK